MKHLRRVYAAFERWDFDELAESVSHDMELILPDAVPFGGRRHGHDGIRSFARLFQEHLDAGFAEPDDFLDAGDRIVVVGRIRGQAKRTGRDFEVPFAHVWGFSDGVPSLCLSYFDTAPIVAAIGPQP
jgi:ketosteroid isomerase-like protein